MYSQLDEETYITAATAHLPTGRFLDIGAYNSEIFSNTRALFERGWSGVMIDCAPRALVSLLSDYGAEERITIVAAAVALERGFLQVHVGDDASITTADENLFQTWGKTSFFHPRPLIVPAITLWDIAQRFGAFDFWNIDVEGFSSEVFLQMLKLGYRPACVCVEHDDRQDVLKAAAEEHGYDLAGETAYNLIFKRRA